MSTLQLASNRDDPLHQVIERGELNLGQWSVVAAPGDVRDAVRVAVSELERVGVAGRGDDATEVVDRVVQGQQGRLLAAVRRHRRGETGEIGRASWRERV